MGRLRVRESAKLLLFGEHSSLYGYPALGIPLDYFLEVEYQPSSSSQWRFCGLELHFEQSLRNLLAFFERKWASLSSYQGNLFISGNIPLGVGFGSSGSLCVALSRLFSQLLNLNLDSEALWKISNEAEKIFHGTPSGVDTGLIIWKEPSYFWMNPPALPFYKFLSFPQWWLVVGAFHRTESTKEIITHFRRRLQINAQLKKDLKELGEISIQAGEEGFLSFSCMATLVNRAHELLDKLGFSNDSLDRILRLGKKLGAPAGKLSGAGKGGAFYFLCETKSQAEDLCIMVRKKNEDKLVQDLTVLPLRSFRGETV